jgi:pimeloyl-ACP methyl ester carboxylesterase
MEKIRSKDRTEIAYQRSGSGPPLVLVAGTLGSAVRWPALPGLAEHFTVYAVIRRGRGKSGDTEPYAIEREFEDVAAVVDSIGGEVNLLGHSFGGLCALEASLLARHVHKLIIYEASPLPFPEDMKVRLRSVIDKLEALLDEGEREEAVATFLREIVQMPAHEYELIRTSPAFADMVDAVHTVPRELRTEESYQLEPERFAQLNFPTLLLVGSDSPAFFKATMERWHADLSDSQIVELAGQQHIAHYTAPDLFVREVRAFLLDSD